MTTVAAPPAVRERPLLMSGPMVRATLAGRKTQTRRVVLPQPTSPAVLDDVSACMKAEIGSALEDRRPYCMWMTDKPREDGNGFVEHGVRCPYGAVGDRLWVRETWAARGTHTDRQSIAEIDVNRSHFEIWYAADCYDDQGRERFNLDFLGRWRPSIHMPRGLSRLALEITDVRVERVQAISREDAIAEGVEAHDDDGVTYYGPFGKGHCDPAYAYARLWDSLNANRGYAWERNPWVWALTFRRVDA